MAEEFTHMEHRIAVGGGLATAVTVIAARDSAAAAGRPPILVFAFPGGGYGRGYFDLQLGDRVGRSAPSYSQAEHHARRGIVVVACDHLGCGDSDATDGLTLERIAAANAVAVAEMRGRIAAGDAAPGLPPLRGGIAIGIGQSMGGCFAIVTQSRHRSFDAVAVLGYSAHHTRIPVPPRIAPDTFSAEAVRYAWHWEDVPEAVVDEDLAGYPIPADSDALPPWRSRTVPAFAVDLIRAGYVADDAAAIDVPVFIAAAERDVVPDLRAEPSAYRRATDVTLFAQPCSAHMHNFASTRALLWERLGAWYASCAALAR